MKLREKKLGDVVTLQRGHDLPEASRKEGTVPVVSSSGITGYHNIAKAQPPGVVTGRYGTLGEVFYIEEPYWPLNTALYAIDFHGNNPRFISYFLKQVLRRTRSDKAAVPGVNRNDLHEIHVRIPDADIQGRIADIAATYDNLIQNNLRRIRLLENAARLLYREWFIFFRFPGHEHTPFVDGLPEGWTRKSLRELSKNVDYGYTASASNDPVGPKFLRITDIVPDQIDWSSVPYCVIDEAHLGRFSLAEGDIVVARTGATVGYAKRLHKRFPVSVFASYLVRLRLGPDLDSLIAGVFVESDTYKKYVLSRVGGAAQPNANAQVLAGAEIVVPPVPIQRTFRALTEPLFDLKEILQDQSRRAREARDLLLPKLISGEVEM
jgi:type I restriction enzyme S subunit